MRRIPVTAGRAGFLLSVSAAFVLGACGGGGGGSSSSSSGNATVSGAAVNAPFLPGATVTCGKIESTGLANTTTASGSISDVNGTFSCTTTWTGPTLVTVNGSYINWANNALEKNIVRVVLNAASGSNTAYANTMTTVAADSILSEYAQGYTTAGSANITSIITQIDNLVIKALLGSDWSLPPGYTLSNLNAMTKDSANSVLEPWNRALLQFDMNLDTQGNAGTGNPANTAKGILTALAAGLVGRTSLDSVNTGIVTAIRARAVNMTALLAAGNYASSGLPTTAASSFAVAAAEYAKLSGTALKVSPFITASSDFTASSGSSVKIGVKQPKFSSWTGNDPEATVLTLSYSLLNTSASGTVYFSHTGSGSSLQTATSNSTFYITAPGAATSTGAYDSISGSSFARAYFAPATADVLKNQTVRITVTNSSTGYTSSVDVPYTALDQEKTYPWTSGGVFTTTNNIGPLLITLSSAFTQTTSTLSSPYSYYISLPYLVMASPTGGAQTGLGWGRSGGAADDTVRDGHRIQNGKVGWSPLATWTPASVSDKYGGFLTSDPAWSSVSSYTRSVQGTVISGNANEGFTYLGGITWTGDSGDFDALSLVSGVYFSHDKGVADGSALTPAGGYYHHTPNINGGYYPGFYSSTNAATDYTLSVSSATTKYVAPTANIGATLTLSNGVVQFSPTANFTPSAPIAFLYAVRDSQGRGKVNVVNVLVLDGTSAAGVNASIVHGNGIGN